MLCSCHHHLSKIVYENECVFIYSLPAFCSPQNNATMGSSLRGVNAEIYIHVYFWKPAHTINLFLTLTKEWKQC